MKVLIKVTDSKNCRPISFLPAVSKIIVKSLHDQLQDYRLSNGLLYKY